MSRDSTPAPAPAAGPFMLLVKVNLMFLDYRRPFSWISKANQPNKRPTANYGIFNTTSYLFNFAIHSFIERSGPIQMDSISNFQFVTLTGHIRIGRKKWMGGCMLQWIQLHHCYYHYYWHSNWVLGFWNAIFHCTILSVNVDCQVQFSTTKNIHFAQNNCNVKQKQQQQQ